MSWYDDDWSKRIPLNVNNGGGSGTIDVTLAIPFEWESFWGDVLSSGNDVRVCDVDGITVLDYQLDSWDYANRTGNIQVDDWTAPDDDAICMLYLYWGNSGASSAAGSFTVASAKTATVGPYSLPPGVLVIEADAPPVGSAKPRARYAWPPNQAGWVAFDVTRHLIRHQVAYQGQSRYEEISYINVETTDNGSAYATGSDETKTRVVESKGRTLILMWLKAGQSGTDYIDEISVTTSLGRTLLFSAERVAYTALET